MYEVTGDVDIGSGIDDDDDDFDDDDDVVVVVDDDDLDNDTYMEQTQVTSC